MRRFPLSLARDQLSRVVNEVAHGGETVILESHGHAKAAIVGLEALARLGGEEELEHDMSMLQWLEQAETRIVRPRTFGEASTEALREVRENQVAEKASVYRRQRRSQAGRRRRR